MGFFKSLRGNHPDTIGGSSGSQNEIGVPSSGNSILDPSRADVGTFVPPPGPPPLRRPGSPLNRAPGPLSDPLQYDPPPGPPPERHEYAPPSGLPPGRHEYAPPPGPPPGQHQYAPPPGPPPGQHKDEPPAGPPPPYHDWTIIPDTALLPPPPSLGHETSPANNSSLADADRAHEWCSRYPLVRPHQPTAEQHASVMRGEIGLLRPREFRGHLDMLSPGTWRGNTPLGSSDSCLVTSSPLYFAVSDSPWQTEIKKTIYFEVKLRSLGHGQNAAESSVALGFCAMPYPTWRLPGWERGSLAVHGDDGRRYVNDTWGGKDFASAFKVGDTVGLGMAISGPVTPPGYESLPQQGSTSKVDVFFTRNGRVEGEWDLHEELDASRDLGIEGLDGQFDLYAAVGCFGGVEFDCLFNRRDWLWFPR